MSEFARKLSNRAEVAYERLVSKLPPALAVVFDLARPSKRSAWGGSLNGQTQRARLVGEIFERCSFSAVIETGTFRGTTAAFLHALTGLPLFTVEMAPRFYYYSRIRFRNQPRIHTFMDDSREFLRKAAMDVAIPKRNVFFYLDAHWGDDLPLRHELAIIGEHWSDSVLVIDDFKVDGDAGYGYDDYGPGRRLCVSDFPEVLSPPFSAFWPTASSVEETGARRGCIVLATGAIAARGLEVVSRLRRAVR